MIKWESWWKVAKWSRSNFWWARLGPLSYILAKSLKTDPPPILIISLPRSGSSWVGEVLGSAKNSLFLSEPITQSDLALGRFNCQPERFDPGCPPRLYRRFADRAFCGLPTFPLWLVVRKPPQWRVSERYRRRLVIKEVKPLACGWLLKQFKPRVIFIVRHPAAMAQSYFKLGWTNVNIEKRPLADRQLINTPLTEWQQHLMSKSNFWEKHGIMQGAILRNIYDTLTGYTDYRIVIYEELCNDPLRVFYDLFHFTGLKWDKDIENLIASRSSGGDRQDSYSTSRNSQSMVNSWKDHTSEDDIENLKQSFKQFNLPWYRSDKDWS